MFNYDLSHTKELIDFFGYYFYIPKGIEEFETAGEYHDYNKHVDLEPLRSKVWKSLSATEMIAAQQRQKITIQEEKVKSLEEVMIANFLFLNGIEYEYERNYPLIRQRLGIIVSINRTFICQNTICT